MSMQFADLIEAAMEQDVPLRLLFLFVKIDDVHAGDQADEQRGTLQPVMVTDKLLAEDLNFAELVGEADAITPGWDFMLISGFSRPDGNLPTSEEVQNHLEQMASAVVSGADLSHFVVFDREETPIRIQGSQAAS